VTGDTGGAEELTSALPNDGPPSQFGAHILVRQKYVTNSIPGYRTKIS
jgi:hypothetical protein